APLLTLKIDGQAIVAGKPSAPLTVMDKTLAVEVGVETAKEREVEVRFAHRTSGADQKSPASQIVTGPSRPRVQFTLERGVNRLVVTAMNKGALAGHEREETAELEVRAVYQPRKEPLPEISAIQVEPAGEEKTLDGRRVLVVDVADVALRATVGAKNPLTDVAWLQDGKATPLGKEGAKEIKVDQKVALPPGKPQRFQLRARSENSDVAEAEITVAYHPRFPRLTLKLPPEGADAFEPS